MNSQKNISLAPMNNKLTSVKEIARQAIVWTDGGLTHWLIYASEGFNDLSWLRGLADLCV